MSNVHPKRPLPATPKKPRADFNWPPTEDELGEYENNLAQSEVVSHETGSATARPEPSTEPVAYPLAEYEFWGAAFDGSPAAAGEPQSGPEDRQLARVEDSTTPALAVAQSETLPDGIRTEWAAEIARLQTLIEQLTQKVDSR